MRTITHHFEDVMSSYVTNSTSTLATLATTTLTVESGKIYLVYYQGEIYNPTNGSWTRLALIQDGTDTLGEISKQIHFLNSVYEQFSGFYRGELGVGSIDLSVEYSNYDNSSAIRARRGRIIVIEDKQ